MVLCIPMAGLGSRFEKDGYLLPKPLIDVNGKPMIIRVIENLNMPSAKHVFVAQKSHCDKYSVRKTLNDAVASKSIVEINGLTEGTACTLLMAEDFIAEDEELIISNSDQLVLDEDFLARGLKFFHKNDVDAGIWCFLANESKWSYARLDSNYNVCEVAEKTPISNLATVGVYYFKKGSSFINAAKAMIKKNIRVNNEFYTCPIFNEMIGAGDKIKVYMINEMRGLGTPEDLKTYLKETNDA